MKMRHDPTMIRPKRVAVSAALAVAVVAGTAAAPSVVGAKMRHEGGAMHPVQVK